jgi:hypothetical protein
MSNKQLTGRQPPLDLLEVGCDNTSNHLDLSVVHQYWTVHRRGPTRLGLLLLSSSLSGGVMRAQTQPPQFYASPNPIITSGTDGATTLYVNAPAVAGDTLSIYVDAPPNASTPGALFATGVSPFSASTGEWVNSGASFFLWDDTTNEIVDGLSVGVIPTSFLPSSAGCAFGPFTTCLDAVPNTNLTATWADGERGTWGSNFVLGSRCK